MRKRVELLEDYRNLLGMFTTVKLEEGGPKLDIYVVDTLSSTVPFGKISSTAAGYYSASDAGIAAYATKGDFGQKVLLHEYAHHYMFAATGQSYPAWYVEGFAEYFMTATFAPTRVEFGLVDEGRGYALATIPWLSWDRMLSRSTDELKPHQGYAFYAQSWLLTHYLFRKPDMREKLSAYLTATANGSDTVAAFKENVFPDLDKLSGALRTYTASSSFTASRLTRSAPPPVAVTVRDLPASADDVLMLYAWLDSRGAAAVDRTAVLPRVAAAAARHPGDVLATRTLAMAELFHGDAAKAEALLDGLLVSTPDDAELLRLKAQALLKRDATANRAPARRLLVKAAKLAPTDWRALHVYVHTENFETTAVSDNLFNVIELMWSLAPQVEGIVLDLATALVQRGRLKEAARVLEPVAFSPHGGPYSRWAGQLREQALAGDKPGFTSVLSRGPIAAAQPEAPEPPAPERTPG